MEETLSAFKELQKFTYSGSNMLDGLTNHIMGSGFNQKIRELRKEFFSKGEFKNEMLKFISKNDMEGVKKDFMSQIFNAKQKIHEIGNSEKEVNAMFHSMAQQLEAYSKAKDLEEVKELVEKKTDHDAFEDLYNYV